MGNMDEGWTRYVFDTFNVPYSSVRDADMRQGSLNAKFDALIFPSQAATQIVSGNAPERFRRNTRAASLKPASRT